MHTARNVLLLPGLGNSGPDHWQSHWERRDAGCRRILQDDWDNPLCADWVARLDQVIATLAAPVVLAAHSSACAMVAHWAAQADKAGLDRISGALLVAPSDPEGDFYPSGPHGFGPMPLERLPFPTITVASADDIYISVDRARVYAKAWASRLVVLGHAGHINAASGFGAWEDGYTLLASLRQSA